MSDIPVNLSSGLGETILEPVLAEQQAALVEALVAADPREALGALIKADPKYLDGWAHLSRAARDDVEAYAYARVGYHRGLDALRKSGWRGTGYVKWKHEPNRGFLRALDALQRAAEAIGETDESERCALFLRQCDPQIPLPLPN